MAEDHGFTGANSEKATPMTTTPAPVEALREIERIASEYKTVISPASATYETLGWIIDLAKMGIALTASPATDDIGRLVERLQILATEALGTAETNQNVEFVEPDAFWQDIALLLREAAIAILSQQAEINRLREVMRESYMGLLVLRTMLKKQKLTLGVERTDKLLSDMAAIMPELPGLSALR